MLQGEFVLLSAHVHAYVCRACLLVAVHFSWGAFSAGESNLVR